ncbi:MAG TPA: NADH:ubiquinone reductase (Na(+)-transporting) subunit A, partial [Planctomycetaceae bacterium]|nr:NADH:ubiquinone reductase (Na(+)-transporting) subunit A [Planctomycetaceae bacterium]
STLTDGAVYLCRERNVKIPGREDASVTDVAFDGPHPAGLPGTHIHVLDPVNESKTVWHINYQEVVAIGHLFLTGKLMPERIISLAGPAVAEPQLIKTRLGASLEELTANTVSQPTSDDPDKESSAAADGPSVRTISGSVLSGRTSVAPTNYLGRYHWQVTQLHEGADREFIGWMLPGFDKFSITRAFASALTGLTGGTKSFTTSTEGSVRAVVPIGMYEKVMPLDIIATPLLKALLVQDSDTAQQLGCLELDEEDLSLCTFVCPGKNEYGPLLRQTLTHIEREG